MPGNPSTLYELCLRRTARLLKNSYWDPDLPWTLNPFASLPSAVIDTLVLYVTRMSTVEPLLSSDLRLLLTSGRVREFILEKEVREFGKCIDVTAESCERILKDLSTSCRNLIAVKICVTARAICDSPIVIVALNSLLSEARNIKYIESFIEFDFRAIGSCFQLEELVLHFNAKNHLCDFLKMNGEMRRHTSLKHLKVSEFYQYNISYLDIAFILEYCTELISINVDISRSLEHLHAEEWKNGTLTHKYKIQKCCLGDYIVKSVHASRDDVILASATCPDLRDLTMETADDEAISAVSKFRDLTALNIFWKRRSDYNSVGMQSLLEKPSVGHNLKRLTLEGFADVDFHSIGMCCPNLEELEATDVTEKCTGNQYSPTSFRKLHFLKLDIFYFEDWSYGTLVGILSNAADLKRLKIAPAGKLTDDVLEVILTKNSLSRLTHLSVDECGLSLRGWRNLARSLRALEILLTNRAEVRFADIAVAMQNINPRIIVDSYEDDMED